MISIFVFVEDNLSDTVVRELLRKSPNSFNITGSVTNGCDKIKKKIKSINESAKGMPFMVLVDLDSEECAPTRIYTWLPKPKHPNLIFRVAVREIESWIMADADGFSRFLDINTALLPLDMDSVGDPKQFLIQLAKKSRIKELKNAIVPKPGSKAKVGPDYNGSLIGFVHEKWDVQRAIQRSDSLKRTVDEIAQFKPL
ncbi:MAG: DUF4276 family protein [bacterium]|nr:DUF4276 family protein [bacterium]